MHCSGFVFQVPGQHPSGVSRLAVACPCPQETPTAQIIEFTQIQEGQEEVKVSVNTQGQVTEVWTVVEDAALKPDGGRALAGASDGRGRLPKERGVVLKQSAAAHRPGARHRSVSRRHKSERPVPRKPAMTPPRKRPDSVDKPRPKPAPAPAAAAAAAQPPPDPAAAAAAAQPVPQAEARPVPQPPQEPVDPNAFEASTNLPKRKRSMGPEA